MRTNTHVSSVNIVDFKMPASLVGTLMDPDTTTRLLSSAQVNQLHRLHHPHQHAHQDKFLLVVFANALLDSAL